MHFVIFVFHGKLMVQNHGFRFEMSSQTFCDTPDKKSLADPEMDQVKMDVPYLW